ncbi:MAG: RHS repeat-associated core domain-containing protein [Chloroflexi bacterium]|nr:RHS repeat-associated core domain-containing protein [Chloroflexota bacterium]
MAGKIHKRLTNVIYPTGENVSQTHNGRGLPYSLSGTVAGNLVTSTLYNNQAQPTDINFNNGLKTTFGYWDVGGSYDTTGGYYGRLWEIKTASSGGGTALQDTRHTWDAGGNLYQREDVLASQTETFGYDFLDRLTSVTGPYSDNWTYGKIGNIASHNGTSYSYGTKPHAVTSVGSDNYTYDDNGNMLARGSDNITWDVENRPVSITTGNSTATFVYDGDGNRVKKVENGETILYVNRYLEVNLSTSANTSYYYLGDRLVAMSQNATLRYLHQDHLTGTSLVTSDNGTQVGSTMKYTPFGETLSGSVPTDKLFTGQRLDDTGLYYYGARYYDAEIGRFVSPDSIVQNFSNPQTLNRYSYVLNNPLKYTDPSGRIVEFENEDYVLELLEGEDGVSPGSALDVMIHDWAETRLEWEQLKEREDQYTKHMTDSEITFNIVDIDLPTQTISYWPDMRGEVSFDEPVQLSLVREGPMSVLMKTLNTPAMSLFGSIFIRTDIQTTSEVFTWTVAHESLHHSEQSQFGDKVTFWYIEYIVELSLPHDLRPSEIRANEYADRYYPINGSGFQQWQ